MTGAYRRVVVIGGSHAVPLVRELVDAGHEVHCVDGAEVPVAWLASQTACDLDSADQLVAAIERIGSVVHALYLGCSLAPAVLDAVVAAAESKSIAGSFAVIEAND